jgi:hypothetical protein
MTPKVITLQVACANYLTLMLPIIMQSQSDLLCTLGGGNKHILHGFDVGHKLLSEAVMLLAHLREAVVEVGEHLLHALAVARHPLTVHHQLSCQITTATH